MIAPLPFLENGVTQVATLVEDLDPTVKAYWEAFGVGPWHFYTYAQPIISRMSYRGKPADYAMRLAVANAGSMRLELIQPLSGASVYADHIARHGYGVQHLGVIIADMKQAISQANAAGFNVIMDGYGFGLDGDGGYAYLDTEDRLGVMLELIQRPLRRRAPEKIFPPE